ncbi:MAG TPA: class I SAM-dependent methyltransferase [Pyrinomonadaceae bacterium]|jgi:SAM-dependent methyltransferase
MNFKDHFSTHSVDYAKYRPLYPAELFAYLASLVFARERAWDCATGNGQAAQGLARFFEHVIATDASQSQIASAAAHAKIEYRTAPAENSGLESGSIDLITVAQALHWLNLEDFYNEAKRTLRPGGVVAVWCYNLLTINEELDQPINRFYGETVGPYWPPERVIVEDKYRSIPFPFIELNPPQFYIEVDWSLLDLLGYLRTWSATQRFIKERGFDPVTEGLADELLALWGEPERRQLVRWPLHLRVGRHQP